MVESFCFRFRDHVGFFRHWLGVVVVPACVLVLTLGIGVLADSSERGVVGGSESVSSTWPELMELTAIASDLASQVRKRMDAQGVDGALPVDLSLRVDRGLGRGQMALELRLQAGRWFMRDRVGVPESLRSLDADFTDLVWSEDGLTGSVRFFWLLEHAEGLGNGGERPAGEHDAPQASQAEQVFVFESPRNLGGRYRASGDLGVWMGGFDLSVQRAEPEQVPEIDEFDLGRAALTPQEAARQAAKLYQTIAGLVFVDRLRPMPIGDAMMQAGVVLPRDQALQSVAESRAYQRALLSAIRAALALAGRDSLRPRVSEDPRFGPFFGHEALERRVVPLDEGGGRIDPAMPDAGPAAPNGRETLVLPEVEPTGAQRWAALRGWQTFGLLTGGAMDRPIVLPEVMMLPGSVFLAADRRSSDAVSRGDDALGTPSRLIRGVGLARMVAADEEAGWVRPADHPGLHAGEERSFAWYAGNEVFSPVDQWVWMSTAVRGRATVWINDELVWDSWAQAGGADPCVMRVGLKSGVNRILVRVASNAQTASRSSRLRWFEGFPGWPRGGAPFTGFALHFALRGSPGTNLAGLEPAERAGPAEVSGYRGDGSSVYAEADPPLAWDLDRGINVAWRIDLPPGLSEPVVAGDRLFVTAEPNVLLAVSVEDGSLLWRRSLDDDSVETRMAAEQTDDDQTRRRTLQANVTPVVDGHAVYVHFGNGWTAAFSLAGERLWQRRLPASWNTVNMGSPVRVDDLLVVQTHLERHEHGRFALVGLDAATGEERWRAVGEPRWVATAVDRDRGLGNGLAVMHLRRSGQARGVIITGDGAVISPADGRILHRSIIEVEANRAAPAVWGQRVYFTPVGGQQAVELWLDEDGQVGARTLWRTDPNWGRGQTKTVTHFGERHWMKPPVIRDGVIYVVRVDSAHVPQHYMCPWTQLELFDARTGQRLSRQRAVIREATDPTVSPVIAGNYLFVADGGAPVGGFGGNTEHGVIAVMELRSIQEAEGLPSIATPIHRGVWGAAYPLARNKIGRTRAAPVFSGDRMFLRSENELVCIRLQDEYGRRHQEEITAQILINEVVGDLPDMPPTHRPEVMPELPEGESHAVSTLQVGRGGSAWLMVGPLEAEEAGQVREALQPEEPTIWTVGEAIQAAGQTWKVRAVEAGWIVGSQQELDVVSALGDRSKRGYFHTLIESRQNQRVRVNHPSVVTGAWLAGVQVRRGDVVELQPGYYPYVIEVSLDALPGFVPDPMLTLGFGHPPRQDDTPELWRQRIAHLSDHLEAIAERFADHATGRSARTRLGAIGIRTEAATPSDRSPVAIPDDEQPASSHLPATDLNAGRSKAAESTLGLGWLLGGAVVAAIAIGVWLGKRSGRKRL